MYLYACHGGIWREGTELHTFTLLGCKCWVVSFLPWPLCLWGRNTWFSLNVRLGGPQNWYEHFGEDKIISCPWQESYHNFSVIQLVDYSPF